MHKKFINTQILILLKLSVLLFPLLTSILFLTLLFLINDLFSVQLNIKITLLHNILTKKIYIKQTTKFIHPYYLIYIYHLKKTIYNLKQTPITLFHHFSNFLLTTKFQYNTSDTSISIYKFENTVIILFLLITLSLLIIPLKSFILLLTFYLINLH